MTSRIDKKCIKTMVLNFIKTIIPHDIKREVNESGIINPTDSIRHSMMLIRFMLILLTSFFYLIGPSVSPLGVKILVVIAMLAAVFLSQNLYNSKEIDNILVSIYSPDKILQQENAENSEKDKPSLLLIVIGIETIGTAFLTLATGGLDSPFVWYALNPIFVAALYLVFYYSWITMGIFLAAVLLFRCTELGITTSLALDLLSHTSLLMLFCLCTALAQVIGALFKKLAQAYSKLERAHQESENSLAHISSLYQVLEACSVGDDSVQMADLLAAYTAKLCQQPSACLMVQEQNEEVDSECTEMMLRIGGDEKSLAHTVWQEEMNKIWNQIEPDMKDILIWDFDINHRLVYQPITSRGERFGILAFLVPRGKKAQNKDKNKSLAFLASLGGITMERRKSDKLWGRLLVSEEQNRIANEIHDGVSQYLFSMVCGVHTLSQQNDSLQDDKIQQQLKLLEDTSRRASQELRASIYKLSPHKRGESVFVETLASYLDDLGRLNGIKVDLQSEGCEEVISPALRKALYRVVREACSNALRHGKCSFLKVSLWMSPGKTVLEIEDNGCGYPEKEKDDSEAGLGMRNMKQVMALFGGRLEIASQAGKGTVIRCIIPRIVMEETMGELQYKIGTAVY